MPRANLLPPTSNCFEPRSCPFVVLPTTSLKLGISNLNLALLTSSFTDQLLVLKAILGNFKNVRQLWKNSTYLSHSLYTTFVFSMMSTFKKYYSELKRDTARSFITYFSDGEQAVMCLNYCISTMPGCRHSRAFGDIHLNTTQLTTILSFIQLVICSCLHMTQYGAITRAAFSIQTNNHISSIWTASTQSLD